MKKSTVIFLCLICSILLIVLSVLGFYVHSKYCLNHFFNDWEPQSNQNVIQVLFPDYLYDKNQSFLFELGEISEIKQRDGFVEEVYCVRNDRIYFCYSTSTYSSQYEEWHLASVSLGGEDFQEHFHNTEDLIRGGKQYEKLSYAYQEELSIGGLYHNGKIFLKGETEIFAYDIDADTVTKVESLPTLEYTFTISKDNQQILIQTSKTNESRIVTLNSMAKANPYAKQLLNLGSKDALDYFFANARSIDGDIYIICSVVGYFRIFSLTFQYDFASDEVHFVALMKSDTTVDNYSIVPWGD